MATASKSEFLVLLADDSQDDRQLLERAFGQCQRFHLLGPVIDGAQAIAYLNGEGKYANRHAYPFPDMLLLDLRMPQMDGFQVLRWLRTKCFPKLLVVVLSGSDHYADISKAVGLGAHFYHIKHPNSTRQVSVLKALEEHMTQREIATEGEW